MVTSTETGTLLPSGTAMVPVTDVKRPRTFEIIRWRTTNSAVVCAGSIA